jgi:luciferase family oxidoreductase group 1
MRPQLPISILDFSPVREGETPRQALQQTVALARHAEKCGYSRFWLTEHHNVPAFASAATSVVMGHVAGKTTSIRVGSGGIMLPNHSPLAIAEQFGTLASLHPGRIDLGVGRATGGSGADADILQALRKAPDARDQFPADVDDLLSCFRKPETGQAVQAVPGGGIDVPVWLLGSSTFSAEHAALLGLPFSFAAHIAPKVLGAALAAYRSRFRVMRTLEQPHVMIAVFAVAAETDDAARHLLTSIQQFSVNMLRKAPSLLPPPVSDFATWASPDEMAHVAQRLSSVIVGSHETVRREIASLVTRFAPDELMFANMIHGEREKLRSIEIIADACQDICAPAAALQAMPVLG